MVLTWQNYIEMLATPMGVAAIFLFPLLLLGLYRYQLVRYGVLGTLLFLSCLGFSVGSITPLIWPFNDLRALRQPISFGLLVAMAVVGLVSQRTWRSSSAGTLPLTLFFVYHVAIKLRISFDNSGYGLQLLMLVVLLFIVFRFSFSRWLSTVQELQGFILTISLTGLVFVFFSLVQYARSPGLTLAGDRFFGMSGNPNFTGCLLAICAIASAYVLIAPGYRFPTRVICGFGIGAQLICMAWSGSRTGMVIAVVGMALLFRVRVLRLAIAGALAVVGFLITAQFVGGIDAAAARIFDFSSSTRTPVWQGMLLQFVNNPVFGAGSEADASESSYLWTLSRSGLFGAIPLAIAMGVTFLGLGRLQRLRSVLRDDRITIDYVFASITAIGAGAVFEGYMTGTLVFSVFAFWLCLSFYSFIIDSAQQATAAPLLADPQYGFDPVMATPAGYALQ